MIFPIVHYFQSIAGYFELWKGQFRTYFESGNLVHRFPRETLCMGEAKIFVVQFYI